MRPESIATPMLVITGEYDLEGRVKAADIFAQRCCCAERAVVALELDMCRYQGEHVTRISSQLVAGRGAA